MEAGPNFLWEDEAHQRRGLEERGRGLVHFLLKMRKCHARDMESFLATQGLTGDISQMFAMMLIRMIFFFLRRTACGQEAAGR